MKSRPSGLHAIGGALPDQMIHVDGRLNPAGRLVLPPKVTRADDHADWLPAASRARARMTCTPVVYADVDGSLKLQGDDVAWPTASPSTW